MRYLGMASLLLMTVMLPPAATAVNTGQGLNRAVLLYQQAIRRNYHNTSRYLVSGRAIVLEGTAEQVMRISSWLDQITSVPFGRKTLQAILSSGNQLTIRHSSTALHASGRTLAPVSADLTNGRGEDVLILFDARIPDDGSHHVFDRRGEPLEFTAVQNLFHELSHARHQTNGGWHYWDSEGQAIRDENRFRAELQAARGDGVATQRAGIEGEQLWWPEGVAPRSGY